MPDIDLPPHEYRMADGTKRHSGIPREPVFTADAPWVVATLVLFGVFVWLFSLAYNWSQHLPVPWPVGIYACYFIALFGVYLLIGRRRH